MKPLPWRNVYSAADGDVVGCGEDYHGSNQQTSEVHRRCWRRRHAGKLDEDEDRQQPTYGDDIDCEPPPAKRPKLHNDTVSDRLCNRGRKIVPFAGRQRFPSDALEGDTADTNEVRGEDATRTECEDSIECSR